VVFVKWLFSGDNGNRPEKAVYVEEFMVHILKRSLQRYFPFLFGKGELFHCSIFPNLHTFKS